MTAKRVGNSHPDQLLEEGLTKNMAFDRVRIFLSKKIGSRAEIEQRYIKQVQEWMCSLRTFTEQSDTSDLYLDDAIMRELFGSMRSEAAEDVENHQRVFNLLMDENGSYIKLSEVFDDEIELELHYIREHVRQINIERDNLDKTYNKHINAHERVSNKIEILENELSQRNRIKSESRTGTRKSDDIRERLLILRRKIVTENEKVAFSQKKCLQTEAAAKCYLTDSGHRLQQIETEHMQMIIAEIRRYVEIMQQMTSLRQRRIQEKMKACVNDDESEASDHHQSNSDESVLAYVGSHKSSSGSSVEVEMQCSAVGEIIKSQFGTLTSNKLPSKKESQESIETLTLPPEVRCPADISNLDPNKQYTTRLKVRQLHRQNSPSSYITEFCRVSQLIPRPDRDEGCNDDSVGKLRNVRVVAVEDNNPVPGSIQLPFRKGQIIKQKCGVNEIGLCYGWTRGNRSSSKQYGFYKQHKVKIFKKDVL